MPQYRATPPESTAERAQRRADALKNNLRRRKTPLTTPSKEAPNKEKSSNIADS